MNTFAPRMAEIRERTLALRDLYLPALRAREADLREAPTIVFATMAKNEAHCIRATLEAAAPHVTSFLVCDTGSTDDTIAIAHAFFAERGIPGEVVSIPWEGFAASKTRMMALARGRAEYILHLDADDVIESFDWRDIDLTTDAHEATMTRGGSSWSATILYDGRLTWRFCGVRHTIIRCVEKANLRITALPSCRVCAEPVGARALDPDKYAGDARALVQQFYDTKATDPDGLHARSAFYAAQSFFDAGDVHEAKLWYERYLTMPTWDEEVFEAHVRIARCIRTPGGPRGDWYAHIEEAARLEPERAEPWWLTAIWHRQDGNEAAAKGCDALVAEKSLAAVRSKYRLFVDERAYVARRGTRRRIIVADDFYADPDAVRRGALAQVFVQDERYYKGQRTQLAARGDDGRVAIEGLLGRKITKWDYPANGVFQWCGAGDRLVYHCDEQRYAAVVYLTPGAPPGSGTSFYRCRATGVLSTDDKPPPAFGGDFYDGSRFELVDTVGNIFNRCVIWDAHLIHAASGYFGDTAENARLFQIFFFDAE